MQLKQNWKPIVGVAFSFAILLLITATIAANDRNSSDPHVKSVRALDDYQLALEFENGEWRIFDMKPYPPVVFFVRLQNVEWPGNLNLSYDTLLLESQPVEAIDFQMAEALR